MHMSLQAQHAPRAVVWLFDVFFLKKTRCNYLHKYSVLHRQTLKSMSNIAVISLVYEKNATRQKAIKLIFQHIFSK